MARRPDHAVRWLGNRVSGASPIQQRLPWTSWSAIERLKRIVQPGMRVFEYGGGGSTLFFLDRGATVTTVENHPGWAEQIRAALASDAAAAERLDLRVVEMPEHPDGPSESLEQYLSAVEATEPWDLILVDGVDGAVGGRVMAVERSISYLRPGGWLVLDDSWRETYARVPQILAGWTRIACRGLGPSRWGVTQTDLYQKPTQG